MDDNNPQGTPPADDGNGGMPPATPNPEPPMPGGPATPPAEGGEGGDGAPSDTPPAA